MSCHFYLMRRRKAAEAAQKAAEATRISETAEVKANTSASKEAVQKVAKGRRKGDS